MNILNEIKEVLSDENRSSESLRAMLHDAANEIELLEGMLISIANNILKWREIR